MNGRELIERHLELWNAKDQAGWSALFTDDATLAGPGGLRGSGPEIVTTFYRLWQESFPDNRCRTLRIVDGGTSGVLEAVFEGTHTETLHAPGGDLTPTGRRVSVPFVNVCEFAGDRMRDFVLYFDQVDLLTQLGIVAATV
ncbi:MAG TPA: nuclear transport factor 2 family protein [Actinomycetospora sp.]|jgi:ketosteroid isomerase-like protein|uniref:nuclear transport factor 2 family protein n=1 Tax=Actinomycetospora sp. TaxID=1872135 RepID=UPI002F423800